MSALQVVFRSCHIVMNVMSGGDDFHCRVVGVREGSLRWFSPPATLTLGVAVALATVKLY